MAVVQRIRENGPMLGGAGVGVGAPVALREFADVQDGQEMSLLGSPGSLEARLTRPSVLWGLGAGTVTGALWFMDVGPSWLQEFALGHALSGVPAGAVSAAFPVSAGSGSGSGSSSPSGRTPHPVPPAVGSGNSNNGSDFDPAGGQIGEMERAN